ncbi:MAG: hypothetical protein HY000_12390 [Planctomycetes bacterium]|nr:hypothetical protein [Planctomycetota bacterium]
MRPLLEGCWRGARLDEPALTSSAGIAVVHYKEDLRFALEAARNAERQAKTNGRDLLALAVCRRSGEHSTALVPWHIVPDVQRLISQFKAEDGPSDRWAYKLRVEHDSLRLLEWEGMKSEVRRLIRRVEADSEGFSEQVFELLDTCRVGFVGRPGGQADDVLANFITRCQSAAFLARGRDA